MTPAASSHSVTWRRRSGHRRADTERLAQEEGTMAVIMLPPQEGAAVARLRGLSEADVAARRAQGQDNHVPRQTSRSYLHIVRSNAFTFINTILFAICVVLVAMGRLDDALLTVGVVLLNVVVGVVQESRAKRALDR